MQWGIGTIEKFIAWLKSGYPISLTLFGMNLEVTLKHGGDTFISFKIMKEPMLVQKQTVPHMKAPILSFLEQ